MGNKAMVLSDGLLACIYLAAGVVIMGCCEGMCQELQHENADVQKNEINSARHKKLGKRVDWAKRLKIILGTNAVVDFSDRDERAYAVKDFRMALSTRLTAENIVKVSNVNHGDTSTLNS